MAEPIETERRDGVALLVMRAGKANALNLALLEAIQRAFDAIEDAAAVVITGEGRAFSAGLALPELIELDRTHMTVVMDAFERAMRRVLAFPRPVVAAINGHAIAGGCVLALMCDARVMAGGDAKIGLNEIQLGIGLPAIVVEPLRARVSPASLTAIALEGRLFAPADALRFGLIDELVEPVVVVERAVALARSLGTAQVAYAQIKRALLAPVLEACDGRRERTRDAWLDSWFSEHAQRSLRAAVARLAKR